MKITNIGQDGNIKIDTIVNLKYNLTIAFVVFLLFFCMGLNTAQAQGIYRANTNNKKANNIKNIQSEKSGGIFKGFDEPFGGGEDGEGGGSITNPDVPGDEPIGEGILILSLLSGVYALIKRNVKKKHEN